MGGGLPKPYLQIGGEAVLTRTLRCFNHPDYVGQIVIAISPSCKELADEAVQRAAVDIPVTFVEGGSERMYSIANALKALSDSVGMVAVHDAVRPFVSRRLLVELIEKCVQTGASIPGVPVTDTIKIIGGQGEVVSTPQRSTLRSIQTPQIFSRTLIVDAYRYALKKKVFGTDDAAIVEQFGGTVSVIDGEMNNFKITYPSDIQRAEELISKFSE